MCDHMRVFYEDRITKLRGALEFYANAKNWHSPSTGFAAQYDPEPSPIRKAGNHVTAEVAVAEDRKNDGVA
jgi:hypothetical protein